jgi:hypothetical protein
MRTPAGKECKYYYEDHFRGREKYECRLIDRNPSGGRWHKGICTKCPVPEILRQNACPNIALEAKIERVFFGLREQVTVFAVCTKKRVEVAEPAVGCGDCHAEIELRIAKPDAS